MTHILICILGLYAPFTQTLSRDTAFMDALAYVESGNREDATSPKGARGLYQIMRPTWQDMTKEPFDRAYDRGTNTRVAQKYIQWIERQLWRHMKRRPTRREVLAAWNGGWKRLKDRGWNISAMPRETRDFVWKVEERIKK